MAYIVVNADVLKSVCGWVITEGDEDKTLTISWDYGSQDGAPAGKVRVHDTNNVEGGHFNDYQIDRITFLDEDLPALQLSNEIEQEDYAV